MAVVEYSKSVFIDTLDRELASHRWLEPFSTLLP